LHILKHRHHVIHVHSSSCTALHHATQHRHWIGCVIAGLGKSEQSDPNLEKNDKVKEEVDEEEEEVVLYDQH
jgi:hypothetical protein